MKTSILVTLLLSVYAQAKYVPDVIAERSLEDIAFSALEYSYKDQVDTVDRIYLAGEFRTKIQSTLVPALVGVGKALGQDDEASAFTTGAVVNVLAPLYLKYPDLQNNPTFKKIPAVIAKAVKTYDRYKVGETYNFYPPLTLPNGQIVRRPIDMTLFPIWHGFTNIPNDSDTTSTVLTSLIYDKMVNKTNFVLSKKALEEISTYQDLNRNPMYYNRFEKRIKTGAFMTWLLNEKDPKMPRFFFASSEQGERIPFNKNDVDCIVNVNILKLLALSKKSIPGDSSACEMINDMVAKDENKSCGVYYPNTYNLGYSLAANKAMGSQCLQKKNEDILVKKIIYAQTSDGNWVNDNIWEDHTLSTVFAVTALLELGDLNDRLVMQSIFYGVHYLMKTAELKDDLVKWPEDNFFTATAIARSLIMWRSKAYTNASIAAILIRVHRLYPQYKVKTYTSLQF